MTTSEEHNRRAWDARARRGERFTRPADDDLLSDPVGVLDRCGWLDGALRGQKVLCLASGAGAKASCSPRPERS